MSGKRVYGSILYAVDGLRHEASGVIDGTFAKQKGGWDSNTVCGQFLALPVETDLDLVITCLRCLGRKRSTGSILRGRTADMVMLDEAQDFAALDAISQRIERASGLPRGFLLGTPSTRPSPSGGIRPATRR